MGATLNPARQEKPDDGFAARRLEQVFDDCFSRQWATQLTGGAQEPFYQPATEAGGYHRLFYRSDYFASALHEVAHWCIAGAQRRLLPDFGYWYAPDGRNAAQQQAFEAVEYKPQALQWWFSLACGYRFEVSVDNLESSGGQLPDTRPFRRRVLKQARYWQTQGLPQRAGLFFAALCAEFGSPLDQQTIRFSMVEPA